MSFFGELKEILLLEGLMPERALLRLRREGIAVYDAKKIEKNIRDFIIGWLFVMILT